MSVRSNILKNKLISYFVMALIGLLLLTFKELWLEIKWLMQFVIGCNKSYFHSLVNFVEKVMALN